MKTLFSRAVVFVAASFFVFATLQGEAAAQCQSTTSISSDCYTGKGQDNQHSRLGWNLLRQKKYQEAVAAYTRAIAVNPNNTSFYNNRAQALEEIGEKRKAIEDYTTAIKLAPRNDLYYLNRGYQYFELQDFAAAHADYEKALSLNPRAWLVRARVAQLHIAMERYPQALDVLNSMIAQNPQNGDIRRLRGRVFKETGKFEQALADFACETFLPRYRASCFSERAGLHLVKNDLPRASSDVSVAIRMNPGDDYAYRVRAEIKEKQGDDLGALLDYTKAVELDSVYVLAYLRRGDVLLRMGRETDALKDYDRAASLERKSVSVLAHRKEAAEKADKIRQAYLAKRAKSPIMIFFDYGLTDVVKSAEPLIEIAAEIVLKGHATAVQVTGHADVVERADNPEIAPARAFAIRSALIRAGVPADKVKTAKGSPNEALIPDVKGEKEPQNRRVVLTFMQ